MIYVNPFTIHRLTNGGNIGIVGYVNTFFAALEPDPYERY